MGSLSDSARAGRRAWAVLASVTLGAPAVAIAQGASEILETALQSRPQPPQVAQAFRALASQCDSGDSESCRGVAVAIGGLLGQPARSALLLQRLCDAGDPSACAEPGPSSSGDGPADGGLARLAGRCEAGDPVGCTGAAILLSGSDPDRAKAYLEKACANDPNRSFCGVTLADSQIAVAPRPRRRLEWEPIPDSAGADAVLIGTRGVFFRGKEDLHLWSPAGATRALGVQVPYFQVGGTSCTGRTPYDPSVIPESGFLSLSGITLIALSPDGVTFSYRETRRAARDRNCVYWRSGVYRATGGSLQRVGEMPPLVPGRFVRLGQGGGDPASRPCPSCPDPSSVLAALEADGDARVSVREVRSERGALVIFGRLNGRKSVWVAQTGSEPQLIAQRQTPYPIEDGARSFVFRRFGRVEVDGGFAVLEAPRWNVLDPGARAGGRQDALVLRTPEGRFQTLAVTGDEIGAAPVVSLGLKALGQGLVVVQPKSGPVDRSQPLYAAAVRPITRIVRMWTNQVGLAEGDRNSNYLPNGAGNQGNRSRTLLAAAYGAPAALSENRLRLSVEVEVPRSEASPICAAVADPDMSELGELKGVPANERGVVDLDVNVPNVDKLVRREVVAWVDENGNCVLDSDEFRSRSFRSGPGTVLVVPRLHWVLSVIRFYGRFLGFEAVGVPQFAYGDHALAGHVAFNFLEPGRRWLEQLEGDAVSRELVDFAASTGGRCTERKIAGSLGDISVADCPTVEPLPGQQPSCPDPNLCLDFNAGVHLPGGGGQIYEYTLRGDSKISAFVRRSNTIGCLVIGQIFAQLARSLEGRSDPPDVVRLESMAVRGSYDFKQACERPSARRDTASDLEVALQNPWWVAFGKVNLDLLVDGEVRYVSEQSQYRVSELRFRGTMTDLYDWNVDLEKEGSSRVTIPGPQLQAGFLTFGARTVSPAPVPFRNPYRGSIGEVYRILVELDARITDVNELRWDVPGVGKERRVWNGVFDLSRTP